MSLKNIWIPLFLVSVIVLITSAAPRAESPVEEVEEVVEKPPAVVPKDEKWNKYASVPQEFFKTWKPPFPKKDTHT